MTWFISTSDIIALSLFGIAAPVVMAGWLAIALADRLKIKLNAALWGGFIALVVILWAAEFVAVRWWLT